MSEPHVLGDYGRALFVHRGNMVALVPLTDHGFRQELSSSVAMIAAAKLLQLQAGAPDDLPDNPLEIGESIGYALKLTDRDTLLAPIIPLAPQTEGKWEFRDLSVEMPQAEGETTARVPCLHVDLVDVEQ